MKRILIVFLLLIFIPMGCQKIKRNTPTEMAAAQPIRLDAAAAEALKKEIEKDRTDTREWLRSSPTSYLAAVDRIDFGQKSALMIGSARGNDVILTGPDIAPHHLRVTLEGDRFRIESLDAKASFKIKEEEKREATVDPAYIQVGRFRLRLSHQRFPAIIVFDPESPRFKNYKGLDYFPIDLSYRYELPMTRDSKQEKVTIMSTRGNRRAAERVGWFDFSVNGQACRLEATRLLEPGGGADDISIFFRDATSGKETYPLGRYVDVKKLNNGKYRIDFNQAYNPACAFSEYYNCPVPPKGNTLSVAIRAGEKDAHYH